MNPIATPMTQDDWKPGVHVTVIKPRGEKDRSGMTTVFRVEAINFPAVVLQPVGKKNRMVEQWNAEDYCFGKLTPEYVVTYLSRADAGQGETRRT